MSEKRKSKSSGVVPPEDISGKSDHFEVLSDPKDGKSTGEERSSQSESSKLSENVVPQTDVKSGDLPLVNIQTKISNIDQAIVKVDWDIKLLLIDYLDLGKMFVVKLTSKWGETDPIFCLPSDFYDPKKKTQLANELMNKGRYNPEFSFLFISYIDNLGRIRESRYGCFNLSFNQIINWKTS